MQSFPMLVEKLEGTVLMGSWSNVESKPLVAEYRVSEPTGILGSVGRAQRSYRSCVVEHQVCCMLIIVEITTRTNTPREAYSSGLLDCHHVYNRH